MKDNPLLNLQTLDFSLYNDYKAGKLTLLDCARKFYQAGWDNYVDEQETARRFEKIENGTWKN